MAIILEASYSKKLGLPNYSSHSYVVSVRTELTDITQVQEESGRLYKLLQDTVDKDIQEVGFIPDATRYGMSHPEGSNGNQRQNGNGNGNGNHRPNGNGYRNGDSNGSHQGNPGDDRNPPPQNGNGRNGYAANGRSNRPGTPVSSKQLDLINRIIRENNADRNEVETTAVEMFGVGVRELNSMQASNLIDELFEHYRRNGRSHERQPA